MGTLKFRTSFRFLQHLDDQTYRSGRPGAAEGSVCSLYGACIRKDGQERCRGRTG
jgi:hypothetical protein